ncbi:uncharacterized protein DS421_13g415670 [Arachis hypogaea]|nr:uncharacterized protein DS421_13g415670 [Arachis hypogaea]
MTNMASHLSRIQNGWSWESCACLRQNSESVWNIFAIFPLVLHVIQKLAINQFGVGEIGKLFEHSEL